MADLELAEIRARIQHLVPSERMTKIELEMMTLKFKTKNLQHATLKQHLPVTMN